MKNTKAFTLIELLTVIAIIGILAGIIIPTVSAVRISAKKAKSRAQFGQWATAYGLFKQEYGYYPGGIGAGAKGSFVISTNAHAEAFAATLTGRKIDGTKASSLNGNKKGISFFSLSEDALTTGASPKLRDDFDNTEISVIYDYDGDGFVNTANDGTLNAVTSVDSGATFTPSTTSSGDMPGGIVRTGVIIYSAGKDGVGKNAVMSWK